MRRYWRRWFPVGKIAFQELLGQEETTESVYGILLWRRIMSGAAHVHSLVPRITVTGRIVLKVSGTGISNLILALSFLRK